MPIPNPLATAAAAYATHNWAWPQWYEFGRETETAHAFDQFPRLERSLAFGDDDYPDVALRVFKYILAEGAPTQTERMDLLVDSMPDLPNWVRVNATPRTKRLFAQYLESQYRDDVPNAWRGQLEELSAIDSIDAILTRVGDTNIYSDLDQSTDTAPEKTSIDYPTNSLSPLPSNASSGFADSETRKPRVFIVHGHDFNMLNQIRVFVHQETSIMPISLAEQPGQGDTIIEKFEKYGSVADYVIVLLSPDDIGNSVKARDEGAPMSPRARQNVVFELGYFIGTVGRSKVLVMDAEVERPSDLAGLSYIDYHGDWRYALLGELKASGLT